MPHFRWRRAINVTMPHSQSGGEGKAVNKERKANDSKKRSREAKAEKYRAKQELLEKKQRRHDERQSWVHENASWASLVSDSDVDAIKRNGCETGDRRRLLLPYVRLKDSGDRLIGKDGNRRFIAEGTETVRLLLGQRNAIRIESIFVKPSVFFDEPVSLIGSIGENDDDRPQYHVLIAEESLICSLLGFQTTRGALACGVVPEERDEAWALKYAAEIKEREGGLRVLALDGVCDTANLGSIIRSASAFAVHVIFLSSDCCDPWYRRSIRVSMGHVFRVPCVRVDNLANTVSRIAEELNVVSYAAVVDSQAELVLEEMPRGK